MISWEENDELFVKGHLSDGKLLLYLDGELSPNEATQVQKHLVACWSCRMNADHVQNAVFAFIKYRNESLRLLPPPSSDEREFALAMQSLRERLGKRSQLASLNDFLRQILLVVRPATLRPSIWAMTGLSVAFVAVAFFIWSDRVPVITASQLLEKAIEAQASEVGATDQPVIYQKLRIRCGARAAMMELWHDKANSRFRQIVGSARDGIMRESSKVDEVALMSELMAVLRANHLNPQQPLSAASFQAWRQSLKSKHEEISRSQKENGATLTLSVTTVANVAVGQIIEASLIVTEHNWRPREQLLKVQGEKEIREYHLSETAHEVHSLTMSDVFQEPPSMIATMQISETNSLGVNHLPTKAELQNAEVAAMYLLHQLKADLGEQIEISRESNEQIVVRGQVDTAERKWELIAKLKEIPFVVVQIYTFNDAPIRSIPRHMSVTKALPSRVENTVAINMFDHLLARYFVEHGKAMGKDTMSINRRIEQMANRAFAEASAAMASGWALRRLVERFNDDQDELMGAAATSQVREIINDHLTEINTRNRNLRILLEQPLITIAGTHNCSPPLIETVKGDRKERVMRLFKAVEQIQRLSYRMFDSEQTFAATPEAGACLMLQALAQLDTARLAVK